MRTGLIIGMFFAIVAPLGVIVWWEFSRARGAPRSVSRAFKRNLDTQASVARTYVTKEAKRGFDAWD